MKWRIEIGAGVGHHLDLADVKLGPLGVKRSRLFPAEKIADQWSG
jgi:hypothetical protein